MNRLLGTRRMGLIIKGNSVSCCSESTQIQHASYGNTFGCLSEIARKTIAVVKCDAILAISWMLRP
jgi:hypothetical protein